MRDAKDMGQRMGCRSLEWNWPKEAMNSHEHTFWGREPGVLLELTFLLVHGSFNSFSLLSLSSSSSIPVPVGVQKKSHAYHGQRINESSTCKSLDWRWGCCGLL